MSVEIARVDHYKANTYTVAPRGRLPLMLHVPVEPIVSILNWSNDPDCCQYGLPTITNMPTVEEGAVPVSPSSGFGYRPISGLHVSKKKKRGKDRGHLKCGLWSRFHRRLPPPFFCKSQLVAWGGPREDRTVMLTKKGDMRWDEIGRDRDSFFLSIFCSPKLFFSADARFLYSFCERKVHTRNYLAN